MMQGTVVVPVQKNEMSPSPAFVREMGSRSGPLISSSAEQGAQPPCSVISSILRPCRPTSPSRRSGSAPTCRSSCCWPPSTWSTPIQRRAATSSTAPAPSWCVYFLRLPAKVSGATSSHCPCLFGKIVQIDLGPPPTLLSTQRHGQCQLQDGRLCHLQHLLNHCVPVSILPVLSNPTLPRVVCRYFL